MTTPTDAPTPPHVPTDEETADGIVARFVEAAKGQLHWVDAMVRSAILEAIRGERRRCLRIVNEMQATAVGVGKNAERAQNHAVMAQAGIAAAACGQVIQHLSLAPGIPVCGVCGGSKVVLSKVALAGGQKFPIPCPACKPKPAGEEAPPA